MNGNSRSPFEMAMSQLNLTPQEQNLYMHHLGNLWDTGKVEHPGGEISTLYQAVVPGPHGQYYNIPTVWDGQILDIGSAKQRAGEAGWDKWPGYRTPDEADGRYSLMHDFMEQDTEQYRQAQGDAFLQALMGMGQRQ